MMKAVYEGPMTFSTVESSQGLKAALAMKRPDLLAEISESGLKGRGGAGFPTGVKWNLAAVAKGEGKVIICNADEGEPGTFKDRVILDSFPDLVFEGMTIAGFAIGADLGIIYLRGEYTYLRDALEQCLARRREAGLLGTGVLDKEGFNFDIRIQMGSGAYICGEETALIESLEGHRGEPRNRPPFPVDTGFQNKPSVVNNVETLCWATCIMAKGAQWFKELGTEGSPGLKLFSVSGDCERKGVYEFPFGISIAEMLKEVRGEGAKAVQVGGAAGHCIPAAQFDRRLSFEDASTGGSIIVFNHERDMLDIAENFLEFFTDESCGQCTPCREGNVKLLEGVRLLKQGRCSMRYLDELCSLGETMQLASKCGLGQSSPNAFLSIVEHFRPEIMGRVSVNGNGQA
jgi:[NiFe] hydrogenase diaphorase moiety large subunit